MNFSELINSLTPEQVDSWWQAAPEIAPQQMEDENWKYRLSKKGKTLPFKWSIREMAKYYNHDLEEFGSSLINREKFCTAFDFEIEEALVYDNSEMNHLKIFYDNNVTKKELFQKWLDYSNSIITKHKIDPYKVRMAIRKSPKEAMIIIGMPNVLTFKEEENRAIVGFILPDSFIKDNLGDLQVIEIFQFEGERSLCRLGLTSWDELPQSLLFNHSIEVSKAYNQIKSAKRAAWNQEANTTNSALKYVIYKGKNIKTFLDVKEEIQNVKIEFAHWLKENAPPSYNYYLGIDINSIEKRLDEINSFFPDNDLFQITENDPGGLIKYIEKNLNREGRKNYPAFDEYNQKNGSGIPKAVMGKTNYMRFLENKFKNIENYWIFQGSPEIYDLKNALKANAVNSWSVANHKQKIKVGDKVIIWQTGPSAGCIALGDILTEPAIIPDTEEEKKFYKKEIPNKDSLGVKIKITQDFSENPILWDEIKDLPDFLNLKVGNQGTNFSATKEEYQTFLDMGLSEEKSSYMAVKKVLDQEKVEQFLSFLNNYFQDNNLEDGDERLAFNVRVNKKRLVFLIGNRYAFSIEKLKNKTVFSFTSQEILSEEYGHFRNRKGEIEATWNIVDTLSGYEKSIKDGFKIELDRDNKSPFCRFSDPEFIYDVFNRPMVSATGMSHSILPLNTILYGPPGTGKTYRSKDLAVRLIDPAFKMDQNLEPSLQRDLVNRAYADLFEKGQIVFTTFHQSFSYEDFVEGIKPLPPQQNGEVGYEVQNGIFKNICLKAAEKKETINFEEAYSQFITDVMEKGDLVLQTPVHKKPFNVRINSNESTVAIPQTEAKAEMSITKEMLRQYILTGEIRDWKPYVTSIATYLKDNYNVEVSQAENEKKNFVLIIDEINRGNVSAILGELITLLESDKRKGREEELSVILPYSKKVFSIPSNLYIIGTMNTADRSVEALDSALRRRFTFEEIMPLPQLLAEKEFSGFNLEEVLKTINERIEAFLDRDHTIGHSYFIKIESGDANALRQAFENKIIPLLQEYFYHDYEKIALILGEGFIERKEGKVVFANFKQLEDPEIIPSYELKKNIEDIEAAVRKLVNHRDEEKE